MIAEWTTSVVAPQQLRICPRITRRTAEETSPINKWPDLMQKASCLGLDTLPSAFSPMLFRH